LLLPNSRRINRGGHDMKSIVEACTAHGVTDLILLSETRGVPDSMIVSHFPHGPTAYFRFDFVLYNCDVFFQEDLLRTKVLSFSIYK